MAKDKTVYSGKPRAKRFVSDPEDIRILKTPEERATAARTFWERQQRLTKENAKLDQSAPS